MSANFVKLLFMDPFDILFSKSSICEQFNSEDELIHHVLARVTCNPKISNSLPVLKIKADRHNKWRAIDNQYLYAYRVLALRGVINNIQVVVDDEMMVDEDFAQNPRGCHVSFKFNKFIFPHCPCDPTFQKARSIEHQF